MKTRRDLKGPVTSVQTPSACRPVPTTRLGGHSHVWSSWTGVVWIVAPELWGPITVVLVVTRVTFLRRLLSPGSFRCDIHWTLICVHDNFGLRSEYGGFIGNDWKSRPYQLIRIWDYPKPTKVPESTFITVVNNQIRSSRKDLSYTAYRNFSLGVSWRFLK